MQVKAISSTYLGEHCLPQYANCGILLQLLLVHMHKMYLVVIFVTPADMKNDSDISASYGSLHQFIHTHKRCCINTGVDDRWWQVTWGRGEVRARKQKKAGVFNIQVECLNNKIQCHAEIINNNNNYSKVYIHKKESLSHLVGAHFW